MNAPQILTFFVAAGLFLWGGAKKIQFYTYKKHSLEEKNNTNSVSKIPYLYAKISDTASVENMWKAPKISPEGENWTFDLFTAPTIVKVGKFFESYYPWMRHSSKQLIPVQLVNLAPKKYPLRLSGFYCGPNQNSKSDRNEVFILLDEQKNSVYSGKIGQKLEQFPASLVSFNEKATGNENIPYIHPELTIWDEESHQEMKLISKTTYYPDRWDILIKSKISEETFTLEQLGNTFTLNEDTFTLKEVLLDQRSVILTVKNQSHKDPFEWILSIEHEKPKDSIIPSENP